MTITFDRELTLRRSKNESFSKLRNEAPGPSLKGISELFFFFKMASFTLLFFISYVFFSFF